MDKDQYIDLLFPIRGLDLSAGYGEQRPQTTPVGLSVRLYEPGTLRARGGQRAGLSKYVAGQLPSGAHVIQHLNYIVDPTGDATLGGGPAPAPGAAPLVPSGTVPPGGGGTGIQPPPKKNKLRTPVIDWFDPADISPNTPLDSAQLNASARDPNSGQGVAGSYVYTPSAGTVLSLGDHQSLAVAFTPSDTTKYRSANKTVHINVVAGLYFKTQPSNVLPATAISPAVVVGAKGADGNPITTFAGNVTLAIASNPSSGTLSGTLTQTPVGGVATFPDLQIDKEGSGYTLKASAATYRDATSASFNAGTIRFVQKVWNLLTGSGPSFNQAFSAPVAANDTLFAFVNLQDVNVTPTCSAVSDSLGNTYSRVAVVTVSSSGINSELSLWMTRSVNSGTCTIAATSVLSVPQGSMVITCLEYSGMATSPIDNITTTSGSGSGSPASFTSGLTTVGAPGEALLYCCGPTFLNNVTIDTSGFNLRGDPDNNLNRVWDKLGVNVGVYSVTCETPTFNAPFMTILASFKS